jgi:hypothetical protein
MAFVRYVGQADVRELNAADFKRVGVEGGKKLSFRRNEPVEVDDSLLESLLGHTAFESEFQEVDDPAKAQEVADQSNQGSLTEKDLVGNEANSGTSNNQGSTTTTTSGTGAGSST